jgi:hypothetical protein
MKESQIQRAIVQYLQLLENQGKLYFIRNNTYAGYLSHSPHVSRSWHYTKQGKKGCADLIIFRPQEVIFCEVKSETGRQSPEQKDFAEKITALGYHYVLVRSVGEVEELLKSDKKEN